MKCGLSGGDEKSEIKNSFRRSPNSLVVTVNSLSGVGVCGQGIGGGMGEQISLMGLEDVKRKVGEIRIQDVLQAQLERIPEVRNH